MELPNLSNRQIFTGVMLKKTAPGPWGLPLSGHIMHFHRDVLRLLLQSVAKYGDVVRFRLGPHVVHLVNHPDQVAHVLHGNHQNYDRATRSVASIRRICGESLLTTSGEIWRRQRRLVQPAFHQRVITNFAATITDAAAALLDGAWREAARTGATLDASAHISRLALVIAGRALFGTEVSDADAAQIDRALGVILHQTFRRLGRIIDPPLWLPTRENRALLGAIAAVDGIVERILARRHAQGQAGGGSDLLALLLQARDPETGDTLSDQQLRNETVTLLLAGHETTATAIQWTLLLLAQNPAVAFRLRQELDAVLGDRIPKFDDLARLPFLNAVLNESLRLYPPIWIIERRAIDDDTIGGYRIPAGSSVVVCPFTLHRHPASWQQPEAFQPERFLNRQVNERNAYLPFGSGPHTCVGVHFALLEARLIVAMICQGFTLHLAGDTPPVQPDPGITLRLRSGLHLRLKENTGRHGSPQEHR
ncbi:MAG: cytochrome P450 [Verrucomicrobia bacterium]|nr:cytochrome P450 [Verrucomicrobiota bacterium]